MKLIKNTEKDAKSEFIVKASPSNETLGLKKFMEAHQNNAATPMVYFEDGLVPVGSPFTSIIPLSQAIVKADDDIVNTFVKHEAYGQLGDFIIHRRIGIEAQFDARVSFLARSLAMNVDQKVTNAIRGITGERYVASGLDFILERLICSFDEAIKDPSFSDINADSDYVTTYAFNTCVVPGMVAIIYDNYDKIIVHAVSHLATKKETAEELHMDILEQIMPTFEMLKCQLEWLFYMLRSEASTIYRPMAMFKAEHVVNDYYEKEYLKESKDVMSAAMDALIEAAEDNPNITITTF